MIRYNSEVFQINKKTECTKKKRNTRKIIYVNGTKFALDSIKKTDEDISQYYRTPDVNQSNNAPQCPKIG